MWVACNANGDYICANYASELTDLWCPACKGRVDLKYGSIRQPHFAHHSLEECQTFSEGETRQHLEGKLELATYFQKKGWLVLIEQWLPHLKQRPDLLIRRQKKMIAIEYQCAPISAERVRERTVGYERNGITVIWILGDTYQGKKLHKLTLVKFMQQYKSVFYVYFWIRFSLKIEKKVCIEVDYYPKWQPHTITDRNYQFYKMQESCRKKDKKIAGFQNMLYSRHRHMLQMPTVCQMINPLPLGNNQYNWQTVMIIWLWLEQQPHTRSLLLVKLKQVDTLPFGCISKNTFWTIWLTWLLRYWLDEKVIWVAGQLIGLTEWQD